MFDFKDLTKLTTPELYEQLGLVYYTRIQLEDFIRNLGEYEVEIFQNIHKQKEFNDQNLDSTDAMGSISAG